jgi:hypothetical protein
MVWLGQPVIISTWAEVTGAPPFFSRIRIRRRSRSFVVPGMRSIKFFPTLVKYFTINMMKNKKIVNGVTVYRWSGDICFFIREQGKNHDD